MWNNEKFDTKQSEVSIAIEENIGVSKTIFIDLFTKFENVNVELEAIKKQTNLNGLHRSEATAIYVLKLCLPHINLKLFDTVRR